MNKSLIVYVYIVIQFVVGGEFIWGTEKKIAKAIDQKISRGLTESDGTIFSIGQSKWRSQDHYWQRLTGSFDGTTEQLAVEKDIRCTKSGMVYVSGQGKVVRSKKWADQEADFRFCIDRYEYPNIIGQNPIVNVTWEEAKALCERQEKRLCTEDEWTYACIGSNTSNLYSYSSERDPTACNNEHAYKKLYEHEWKTLALRDSKSCGDALERLWQGEPIGQRKKCKSPFGAYDMVGNIDEWTTRSDPKNRYVSVLKGGYWGPVTANCMKVTDAHWQKFAFYQIGFRCCSDN